MNVNKHPTADLYIYNYSLSCQFARAWDDVTLVCRGLILDGKGNPVAVPFKKFFNYGQAEAVIPPGEKYQLFDRADGSLGILYWINDTPYIASRGSFVSDQALAATDILHKKYSESFSKLDKTKTYIFEIIYPSNRIVIDYKGLTDIILLGLVDNSSFKDIGLPAEHVKTLPFTVVTEFPDLLDKSFDELQAMNLSNKEGYVLRFESGQRLKIKFKDYIELHSIITETSSLSIWRAMSSGKSLEHILENVPDEFFQWARDTIETLQIKYNEMDLMIKENADWAVLQIGMGSDRKKMAEFVMSHFSKEMQGYVFATIYGKDCNEKINTKNAINKIKSTNKNIVDDGVLESIPGLI